METEILNTPLPQCNNTGMCHSKALCEYCIAEPGVASVPVLLGEEGAHLYSA